MSKAARQQLVERIFENNAAGLTWNQATVDALALSMDQAYKEGYAVGYEAGRREAGERLDEPLVIEPHYQEIVIAGKVQKPKKRLNQLRAEGGRDE